MLEQDMRPSPSIAPLMGEVPPKISLQVNWLPRTEYQNLKTSAQELSERKRARKLPENPAPFFIDGDLDKGLALHSERFKAVDRYINGRVEKFIVRSDEVNQKLLKNERFRKAHPHIKNTKELSAYLRLVADTIIPKDENGDYYLPCDDMLVNLDKQWGRKRFNWDTELNLHALLNSDLAEEDKFNVAMGTMWNAFTTFENLHFVPNGTSVGFDDRTQPPRHTTMLRTIEDAMSPELRKKHSEFFAVMWQFALEEYWTVFNANDPENPYSHDDPLHQNPTIRGNLMKRWGGKDACNGKPYHHTAELGGGHDFTGRFEGRAADYEPIDMLMYLHDYERHFAERAKELNDDAAENYWKKRQAKTIQQIMEYHVPKDKSYIYDYDFENDRLSPVKALVGMLPYADINDPELKKNMMATFRKEFFQNCGLILTLEESHPKPPTKEQLEPFDKGTQLIIQHHHRTKQWNGPNQFYNITSHVVDVLIRAEEYETAAEVIENTLVGMVQYFEKVEVATGEGKLPEKLNARTGEKGGGADYIDQDELLMSLGYFKRMKEQVLPMVYERRKKLRRENEIFNSQNIFSFQKPKRVA